MGRRSRRPRHARAQPARAAAPRAPLPPAGLRDDRRAPDRHRGHARAAAARQSRDRPGDRKGRLQNAVRGRDRVPDLGPARMADDLPADLPRRLGRSARARRPAAADLRAPAVASDRLLREPPGGGADLAHDQRRRGARQPRDRFGRDAVPVGSDPDRHDRHPALPRPQARAAHVPRAAAAPDRLAVVPDRLRRRVPPHPRDDRRDHRRPSGEPLGGQDRAQLRPGAGPPRPLHRPQQRQPGREHGDGQAQRRVLPERGNALGARGRGDRRLRRPAGDRRSRHGRHGGRFRRRALEPLRTDPAALPAVRDLPVRHGGAREDLPAPGRPPHPHRPPRRDRARAHPGRGHLRRRLLRLCAPPRRQRGRAARSSRWST